MNRKKLNLNFVDNNMNPLKKYYQPDINKHNVDDISSFEVYHLKKNAQKDFSEDMIIEYKGDDIEFPHFRDTENYVKTQLSKINTVKSNLKQMITDTIEALIYHHTDEDHTFIELASPVAINWFNDNNYSDITRVYRDGGLVIKSHGNINETKTIFDLNSDELYDLMIQIKSNNDVEDEVS